MIGSIEKVKSRRRWAFKFFGKLEITDKDKNNPNKENLWRSFYSLYINQYTSMEFSSKYFGKRYQGIRNKGRLRNIFVNIKQIQSFWYN